MSGSVLRLSSSGLTLTESRPTDISSIVSGLQNTFAILGMADSSREFPLGVAQSSPGISLVIPAYNEAASIAQAVTEAVAALASITDDFEVLVVDDGSTDATATIVRDHSARDSRVRLVELPKNCGYGAALRRGFGEASKDLVGFTDADCQFDLRELDRLVLLARDYDIVSGYRIDRQDPWLRRVYSAGYNVLVRLLLGTRVRDCDCALKLYRRNVLTKLPITTDGFLINGEMLSSANQQGFSLVEVGVSHRPRSAGHSKVSVAHIPVVLLALVRFWWNRVVFAADRDKAEISWTAWTRTQISLLLVVLAGCLAAINLGYPFIEPDEARYAQISLEMLETHEWLVPTLHGEPYLDKPPLLYWLIAASYSVCGVGEWQARLPGTMALVLTVLATFVIGRRLLGDRAACCGAVLLLMCGGFVLSGRYIMMDGVLAMFTTVTLLTSYHAMFSPVRSLHWWAIAGAACGFGILTKGPVAPVVCIPPVLGVAWLTRNRRVLQLGSVLSFAVPMLVVSLPWFVWVAAAQEEFVAYFFWKHHVLRYINSFDHAQPWWFYGPMLMLGMLPVALLFPALGVYLARRDAKSSQLRTCELGAIVLAAAWIVVFFTLSSCKLVTYMLPVYPLLALACGKLVCDVLLAAQPAGEPLNLLSRRIVWFSVGVMNWAILGGLVFLAVLGPKTSLGLACFGLLAAVVLVALYSRKFDGQRRLVRVAVGSYGVAAVFGLWFLVPEFAQWRSIMHSAALLQTELGPDVPVVFFGQKSQAASFEIAQGVVEFPAFEVDAFERYMSHYPVAIVVTDRQHVAQLRDRCGDTFTLAEPRTRARVYVATRRHNVASQAAGPQPMRR